VEPSPRAAAARLVVALHGHEDDPRALADRLDSWTAPDRLLVTPESAFRTEVGPVWFHSDDDGPVEAEVVSSLDRIDRDIAEACATHGLDRSQVVVGGYSQGGALALALALRGAGSAEPLAGVYVVSTWLPHIESVVYDAPGLAASGTPVLVVHGADDEVVIVQQGRSAARFLKRHGVTVDYVELPGGHHLGPPADAVVAHWLGA
jgi:phospholipase/carboxylesterase